jgi:hypothetical protein
MGMHAKMIRFEYKYVSPDGKECPDENEKISLKETSGSIDDA